MRIKLDWAPPAGPVAIAIGNFDGVHRGHQALLRALRARAEQQRLEILALTFEPHPLALLDPRRTPARLLDLRGKAELLAQAGAAQLNVMRFTQSLSQLPARAFVERLCAQLRMKILAVGEDFRFGHKRTGDVAMLRELADELGFQLLLIEDVTAIGDRVASKGIRAALQSHEFDKADEMLGRSYCLQGRVVHGHKLGRELGCRTANLRFAGTPPLHGIYAATAQLGDDDREWATALSVGRRPTVDGKRLTIEAHLLDYTGPDFYGTRLRVQPRRFLHPEREYSGLEELRAAIAADVAECRARLAGA